MPGYHSVRIYIELKKVSRVPPELQVNTLTSLVEGERKANLLSYDTFNLFPLVVVFIRIYRVVRSEGTVVAIEYYHLYALVCSVLDGKFV